jgi:hypothetical protein
MDAPSTAAYNASFGVAATAPGGIVAFSSSGACTNVGATFTMTSGTGTCTVQFDRSAGTNYNAAPQVTESVTATKAGQSITFAIPADRTYGDANFNPGATASSGDSVSYTTSDSCSIVSGKVHITGAGSCSVMANQAGDTNYNAAPQVKRTFSVAKAALSITATDRQKFFSQPLTLGKTAFTGSGLVGSDSVSRVTLASGGAGKLAATGSYPIVASHAVGGAHTDLAGNYTITYHQGTLRVLTVAFLGLNGVSVTTSGGKIDSFDSSVGPYGPANHSATATVVSNGSLSLSGVALFGSATSTRRSVSVAHTARVTGNVTAGTTASIHGRVGGTVSRHSRSSALAGQKGAGCSGYSSTSGMSGGKFSYSAKKGNLTLDPHGTVKLESKTYCFDNITLSVGSVLSVSGPVTIHLSGRLTSSGQLINTTNLPAALQIVSTYAGSGGVAIIGGTHAYMKISAPRTTVTIAGGSFFGTLLAGAVNLTGTVAFHEDVH